MGSEKGTIYVYDNVGSADVPKLGSSRELALSGDGFERGYRCRIGVVDWNNDRKLDLLVGNIYRSNDPKNRRSGGNVWLFLGE